MKAKWSGEHTTGINWKLWKLERLGSRARISYGAERTGNTLGMAAKVADERPTTQKDINSVISSCSCYLACVRIEAEGRTKGDEINEGGSVDRTPWPGRPAGENPNVLN